MTVLSAKGDGRKRVVVERVFPEIDGGIYPIKRVVGEDVIVEADILADGHDAISARIVYCTPFSAAPLAVPLRHVNNDRWRGSFQVERPGLYTYTVEAWIDRFKSWQKDFGKRCEAERYAGVDLLIGVSLLKEALTEDLSARERAELEGFISTLSGRGKPEEAARAALSNELTALMEKHPLPAIAVIYEPDLTVSVERPKALFSTWYEFFPRSWAKTPGAHGTFRDCERLLPELARMGFDVVYLPPIHPIGRTNRKGKDNSLKVAADDVGSPWAIGSDEGGHRAIHPALGSMEDFRRFVRQASDLGIEVALDLAFQCSPDHPYVKEHPGWFRWRPDGTVQFAENPPKCYEDIIPINFECDDWEGLWQELKDVTLFWCRQGVSIFRADNPHTKPFRFWGWLIAEIRKEYPETIFLAEAFTRPKIMYQLGKRGFSQSYTYFTWRNTKREFIEYLTELTKQEVKEYFRPNFWPNTPDILAEQLQFGGRPAFMARLVLAATLSSNYGIYGPAFELCVRDALPGMEEYRNSEKYEIRRWDWNRPGNLREFIARMNRVRKENPALQTTWNLRFLEADNEAILFYVKTTEDLSNIMLVAVNLDPFHIQSGWVHVPIGDLGIDPRQPYLVHDLLSDEKHIWQGERNYVELNPSVLPAAVLLVRRRLRREMDFDYFM